MNNKNLFIVVVVLILVLAGAYAFMQYQEDKQVNVSLNNSQASNGNLDYTNSDYGFKMNLTPAWDGYRVFELGSENVSSYDFCVRTTDTTYATSNPDQAGYACPISVYAVKEGAWNAMADLERASFGEPRAVENGVRFFVNSWNAPAQDLANTDFDINGVMSTFKF